MTDDVKAILAAYKCGSDADLLHKFIDAATCFIPKGAALGALDRLVAGHRAEVKRLTKERDHNARMVYANECDAAAAEKSRDEAVAELNKALETLGQLRSDLQMAEEGRKDALIDRDNARRDWVDADREATTFQARAQSAEDSLAKLREVATKAEIALENVYTLVWGECPSLLNEDSGGSAHLDHDCRTALAALRSLLDEPDKDQNNAKR